MTPRTIRLIGTGTALAAVAMALVVIAGGAGHPPADAGEPRAGPAPRGAHATAAPPRSLVPPLRLAFYYPWFPETWRRPGGGAPFTRHRPALGLYRSDSARIVRRHIAAMRWGGMHGALASWWGRGTRTDARLPLLLRTARRTPFRWGVYYEPEGRGDPAPGAIARDLRYIGSRHGRDRGLLRIAGRFVVFAYGDRADRCDMVDRWRAARVPGAYIVLKVFPGYRSCANQPDGWHQYAPATAEDSQPGRSFSISPGFFHAAEGTPRLSRSLPRWRRAIRRMTESGAPFQLITTFNEWGEGTAVEASRSWPSRSGFGRYLDALHAVPTRRARVGGRAPTPPPPGRPAPATPPVGGGVVVAAAGDLACDPSHADFNGGDGTATKCRQLAVSDLLADTRLSAFLALGDTQYETGTLAAFMASFDRSYGRFTPIIRPAVGNHEYLTDGAAGYFDYFGAIAGERGKGYYSYELGAWHVVALNSNCSKVGGCGAGSPQEQWLRDDLAAHPAACTLAYWHHPRFSSGSHGGDGDVEPLWRALREAGAEIVLNGHDHDYERFAPQTETGEADPQTGIREFVVGTGGRGLTQVGSPTANSEVLEDGSFGVLELTLRGDGYDWRFLPAAGDDFRDEGSGTCH